MRRDFFAPDATLPAPGVGGGHLPVRANLVRLPEGGSAIETLHAYVCSKAFRE